MMDALKKMAAIPQLRPVVARVRGEGHFINVLSVPPGPPVPKLKQIRKYDGDMYIVYYKAFKQGK